MTAIAVEHRAPEEGFAALLRSATRPEHEAAEGSAFMSALTDGQLSRDAYAALLAQTWYVYDVLERATIVQAQHPVARPFIFTELTRLPSLQRDLDFLLGTGWSERVTPLPATVAYCDRLREVCFTWPAGFVAHHYTRYLGDLSGGQILRRLMERQFGLDTHGVRFYLFEQIPKPKPFKDEYRDRLDALVLSPIERERMVEEVRTAFRLNTALFADLGADLERYRAR